MNAKPPSKNSRCPCGSGKKFRKCCRKKKPPQGAIEKALRHFRAQEERRREFTGRYGHARPPMSVKMGDKRLVAIGGAIYKQTRDGPYTFMDAIHDHALEFFGIPYMEVEEAKPFEQRHPAIQWMHAYVDLSQRLEQERNTDPRAGQIGGGAAWFRFVYDLFTIRDNVKLQNVLRKKLLTGKDFQSARHELWVAALCVVAGFDLTFEDETDNTRGHTEFIATDRFSPAKIAVEAKSRHRRGVKGFKDGVDRNPGASVGVRGLVLEAYSKPKDLPLYVFVDVNLPPVADEETWNQWLGEIDTTMSDLQAEGYADPCPANIVFFCNDPSHYLISEQIGNDSDRLWIKHYEALSPRFPHPSEDMPRRFLDAHRQRLAPPADFPEFQ